MEWIDFAGVRGLGRGGGAANGSRGGNGTWAGSGGKQKTILSTEINVCTDGICTIVNILTRGGLHHGSH